MEEYLATVKKRVLFKQNDNLIKSQKDPFLKLEFLNI